jgi:hypothetical protein
MSTSRFCHDCLAFSLPFCQPSSVILSKIRRVLASNHLSFFFFFYSYRKKRKTNSTFNVSFTRLDTHGKQKVKGVKSVQIKRTRTLTFLYFRSIQTISISFYCIMIFFRIQTLRYLNQDSNSQHICICVCCLLSSN